MSQKEIRFRIRNMFLKWIEYIIYRTRAYSFTSKGVKRVAGSLPVPPKWDAKNPGQDNNTQRDRFFTETIEKSNRIELIKANLDASSWTMQSNRLLEGWINLLGHECKIPFSGGWHTDPIQQADWPQLFYAHIKKDHAISGWDIKYIWELNRHQYLITLAKTYWLTDEERYAGKAFSAISSWIDENPLFVGVNWTSSLELAVRTISWIWTYFLCHGSMHLTRSFQNKFINSIYQQAKYIEKHLSFYSSPYNHLIGEAAALHLIGSLFPMFKRRKYWERLGWSIMVDRIEEQFHKDGMSVEQATFYHHFTLGFYLQSIFLRRNNNKEIPEKVLDRIEKALEIAMHLTKPDGTLPMIGDIDNARSLYFDATHSWDFRSFLTLGAILFNRPDFKQQSRGICEELIWLASKNDIESFVQIEPNAPKSNSFAFYDSGYFVSRNSWNSDAVYLCFDCGEISAGLSKRAVPSAAHGHADALSFELAVKGKSFIVDGGFYTYFGDVSWHRHFRQEEAHNTVLIGNCRQSEYFGRLTWQNVKRPKLLQWESTPDFDAVSGRISYVEDRFYQRQLICCKNHFYLLRDTVRTNIVNESVKSFLHFSPEVNLHLDQTAAELVASIESIGLFIKPFGKLDVSLDRGGKTPDSGWVAQGYGIKNSAWKITFSGQACNPLTSIVYLMIPFEYGHDSILFSSDNPQSGDMPLKIAFSHNDTRYAVDIGHDSHISISINQHHFNVPMPAI